MTKPTQEELRQLRASEARYDDEEYHSIFDDLIEAKLMELDPEWMQAMQDEYKRSDMARWCA